VEFVKNEVASGKNIRDAAVDAAKTRFRPIMITSLTLMAGAMAILQDPIFNGMAVTLLFGTGVATLFTLIVIPMGCISAEKRFVAHGCAELEERIREEDEAEKKETPA
jgi:multidrug efflux pump subunit AcrB